MHELPAGEAVSGTVLDDDQSVEAATKASIKAAKLGTIDLGAARTLEGLAKDVDSILTTGLNRVGKFDNTVIPTYLRFCEALGLTPSGRARASAPAPTKKSKSKLGEMRDRHLNAVG
ncbi:terminase small subunit [Propionibacteriaceae bacterium Y2011]